MTLSIRFARPTDAPWLAAISGTGNTFDWTLPGTTEGWWIAELGGAPVACVQMLLGRPVGRVESFRAAPDLPPRVKAEALSALVKSACTGLYMTGSQGVMCFVRFDNKGMKRFLKRRFGAKVLESGNLFGIKFVEMGAAEAAGAEHE